MKQILLLSFICVLFIAPCLPQNSLSRHSPNVNKPKLFKAVSTVPISGCYTDTTLIKNEGLVVGNGSFTIRKVNKRYVAIFSELASDGGASHPDVTVKNLVVNESKRIIIFDLPLHSGTILRQVKGQVSRKGVKLKWRKNIAGEYGQPSPFMKREKCTL